MDIDGNTSTLNRIGELSELHTRLWDAFKASERLYVPASLHPMRVWAAFFRLARKGHLRWFEAYPFYATLVAVLGIAVVVTQQFALAPLYGLAVWSMVVTGRKHQREFVREKSKSLNLPLRSFNVQNLSLLIFGIRPLFSAEPILKEASWVRPASMTRANLASVIKLIKASHDHGEVSVGFHDAVKRLAIGGLLSLPVVIHVHLNEISSFLDKAISAVQAGSLFMAFFAAAWGIATVAFCLHFLIDPVLEKKRRRRYLLALSALHECWDDGEELEDLPQKTNPPPSNEDADSADQRDTISAMTLLVGADDGEWVPGHLSLPVRGATP